MPFRINDIVAIRASVITPVCEDGRMPLRGYLDGFQPSVDASVLVDATSWLDDPLFWPAFLLAPGGSFAAAVAFDADPADVEAYAEEMHQHDSWPVISLDLARGHRLHILFRNFDGDSGWDYLVQPTGSDTAITAAALDGGFHGPALSWSELVKTASRPNVKHGQAERLLLLLPAIGDSGIPPEAHGVVTSAVTAVGATHRQDDVARELLNASHRFWGESDWGERHGLPVCLGGYSPRHSEASLDRLALMAEAFGG
ncbi:hypothetical protein DDE19_31080 [Micromonospora ureilytica]|uniref:Uncharacterized protein n=1 Tax=Micromonospora ureilytica TaxID=709868 RepID=A0A3N9XDS7_9ACTN|nr:hypothetical protein [Micromonospora ureilytica]RQX11285.1 hypothetical protein DDE19_31080 [Micromonospora ureilytica]